MSIKNKIDDLQTTIFKNSQFSKSKIPNLDDVEFSTRKKAYTDLVYQTNPAVPVRYVGNKSEDQVMEKDTGLVKQVAENSNWKFAIYGRSKNRIITQTQFLDGTSIFAQKLFQNFTISRLGINLPKKISTEKPVFCRKI